jgi:GH18 family chitinase
MAMWIRMVVTAVVAVVGMGCDGSGGSEVPAGSGGTGPSTGGAPSGGGSGTGGVPESAPFAVIGYLPSWSGSVSDVAYDRLTHVNYAFALPTPAGALEPVENEAKLTALVTEAHARNVKVLISIGGWNDGDDSAFHALAAAESTRTAFANTVHAYVTDHSLDGADIDWEYPEGVAAQYTDLIGKLSQRLRPEGRLVTAAVSASSWGSDGITPAVYPFFDYLNLMAYDGGDGADHSPYAYAVSALDYWLGSKAAPRAKVVLGVPFYARPSWSSYASIVAQNPAAAQLDVYNGDYYNGIPTIQAKTELALGRAAGIMLWELSQDTQDATSLLAAIDRVVHP